MLAATMLEILEHAIRAARAFTIVKLMVSYWFARRAGIVDEIEREIASRPPHPSDAFEERLNAISQRYLFLTSPAGWLAPIWLPIGWALYRLFSLRPPYIHGASSPSHLVERPVRTETELPAVVPTFMPYRYEHEQSPLAACVG